MTKLLAGHEPKCEIAFQWSGDHGLTTVVHISGEVDLVTASTFRSALDLALEHGATVIVDMAGVRFIGSCGIATLEDAALRARERNSELLLRSPSPMLRKLIHVLVLAERLPIEVVRSPTGSEEAPMAHRLLMPK